MTKSLDSSEQPLAPDAEVLSDIKRVGWYTLGVSTPEGEGSPDWAFSVGLYQSFGHPEVILLGLPVQTCMQVVNVIGRHVKDGTHYESDHDYADILAAPIRCAFRNVQRSQYRDHVGYVLWFYESDEFPLLQCFWPDEQLRFPWDDGCNESVRTLQRTLCLP